MKYFAIAISLILSSCSLYTEISYREGKKEEYIREDGFMLNFEQDDNTFVISTFTPESWSDAFYYGFLRGIQSSKRLKVSLVDLRFLETGDTLTLKEVSNERIYVYTSENVEQILKANKHLKAQVLITDLETGKSELKEYVLTRKKHTFINGSFPHTI